MPPRDSRARTPRSAAPSCGGCRGCRAGRAPAIPRPRPTRRDAARARRGLSARLFGPGAGDLHGSATVFAVFFQVRTEFIGPARDDFVAFVDELLLPELGVLDDLPRVEINFLNCRLRRAGGEKQAEPGVRLDLGKAELRKGRHFRQERRARLTTPRPRACAAR